MCIRDRSLPCLILSKEAISSSVIILNSKLEKGTTPEPIGSPKYSQRYLNSFFFLTSLASSIKALDRCV